MTIIADSGSTKTTWMDVESGNKVVTEGLNPHFTSENQFYAACQEVRQHFPLTHSPFAVFFYGAGCGLPAQRKKAALWLAKALGTSDIHVETDMLGACRATAGDKQALVAILGTGSNACLYDGRIIRHQPASTGYILGDKGSANHLGRLLLDDYLMHRMPTRLRRMFHDTYPMSDAEMMDAVYHQPNPNRFLASLVPFGVQHKEEEYCNDMIVETIAQWYFSVIVHMKRPATKLFHTEEMDVHIVGGFAKAIEPQLRELFEDPHPFTLHLGNVVADPIDGLREFHLKTICHES